MRGGIATRGGHWRGLTSLGVFLVLAAVVSCSRPAPKLADAGQGEMQEAHPGEALAERSPLPPATVPVPSSPRSRAVAEQMTPRLEREFAAAGLRLGDRVFIRIFKHDSTSEGNLGEAGLLEVWVRAGERYRRFRSYRICYFSGELGPKIRQGDGQAPEGFYFVTPSQMNPSSRYHLSFNLGYPNAYDRAHGRTGSALMVHGSCVSIGCYAMTNPLIDEIWTIADAALRQGQPFFRVHIFPFRLTPENLALNRANEWVPFWENLAEGYRWFEERRVPPEVTVEGGQYRFR